VSVVIPTHQRRASVERVLASLADQSLPPDEFEVVVAIDGSTDGTRELVDAVRPSFALRSTWKPRGGRASACNAGWRIASGSIVVFLDDDMEATREFLAAHVDAHASAPNIGLVGAVPITIDSPANPVTRYVADRFNAHLRNLAAPGYEFGLRDFYSGNFSVAREALERIGGFDESFVVYGNEDLDLSLRLRGAGVRLVFSSAAVAHQHYEKDFPALSRDNFEKGRTAAQLVHKHPASFTDLKLSQFDRGRLASRLARNTLLGATQRWPDTRERVVRLVTWLTDRRLPGLRHVYPVVLDYLYWLGASMPPSDREGVEDPTRAPALGR